MLERFSGGEHGLLGAHGIAAIEQDVARQPIQLTKEWHPLQALFADAYGAFGHHAAKHIQVIVGLVVGDDHAGALVIEQRLYIGLQLPAQ